jgi:hypothetical protein
MNCINCGKPFSGATIPVFGGLFQICKSCDDFGNKLSDMLTQGIEVEVMDPKTKQISRYTTKG